MTEERFFRFGVCGVGLIAHHEFVNMDEPIMLTWIALMMLSIGLENIDESPTGWIDAGLKAGAFVARLLLYIMITVVMLDFLINY